MGYKPIESYGVIGDLHTVALVGIDGSIDWCCMPYFDSPSVFAAILDDRKGGSFRIASLIAAQHKQMYMPDSNVLVTRFLSDEGYEKARPPAQSGRADQQREPEANAGRRADGAPAFFGLIWSYQHEPTCRSVAVVVPPRRHPGK